MACILSADVVHDETGGLVSEGVVPTPGGEPGPGRVAEMFALLQHLARHAENDLVQGRERHARSLLHILTRG